MVNSARKVSRTSVKLNMVAEEIRRQIVQGELGPGDCLPTRTELQETFGVSRVTVQRALDRLMEDGFIVATPGMGTFITDRPPHLFRIGLVFPKRPTDSFQWPPFWTALRSAANSYSSALGYHTTVYYSDRGRSTSKDYALLERDVLAHTVAGLIFVSVPSGLEHLPPLLEPGIPRLAIHEGAIPEQVGVRVRLEARSFIDHALDYLVMRGRSRIALITDAVTPVDCSFCSYFLQEIARRNLVTHPFWIQAVRAVDAQWAQNVSSLLMQGMESTRPDGMIIARESLVEYAKGGIVNSGTQAGKDVDLVVYRNLPSTTPEVIPAKRVGHDVREVLEICISSLLQYKSDPTKPLDLSVQAKMEDEIRQVEGWEEKI